MWERFKELLEDPEVLDVLIFGSTVRGKQTPSDLDVCVIWKGRKRAVPGAISKTYAELFSPDFLAREDVLSDAFSLRLNKRLAEAFGYDSFVGFMYSLRRKDYNERARFHNALRNISKELEILRFKGFALVPVAVSEKFKDFLEYWKVPFRETRILFPKQEYEFLQGKKIEETLL